MGRCDGGRKRGGNGGESSGRSERGEINWKERKEGNRQAQGRRPNERRSTREGSCVRRMWRRGAAGSEASAEDINNLCSIKQFCVRKNKKNRKRKESEVQNGDGGWKKRQNKTKKEAKLEAGAGGTSI